MSGTRRHISVSWGRPITRWERVGEMAKQRMPSPETRAWLKTMPPFEGCPHALRLALALAGVRMGDSETTDYDRIATALLLRYGPDGPLTYDEIGAHLGLSGPHIDREVV